MPADGSPYSVRPHPRYALLIRLLILLGTTSACCPETTHLQPGVDLQEIEVAGVVVHDELHRARRPAQQICSILQTTSILLDFQGLAASSGGGKLQGLGSKQRAPNEELLE